MTFFERVFILAKPFREEEEVLFPRSNEPSSHACMDIWRLLR